MPTAQSPWFFLGAAVVAAAVGIIGAAGMFMKDRYRQEKQRHGMAQDLVRLDEQLCSMKRELERLKGRIKTKTDNKQKSNRTSTRSISIVSTTSDDYTSALEIDSSDLEFYDLSDDEVTTNGTTSLEKVYKEIDDVLDSANVKNIKQIVDRLKNLCAEYPDEINLLWKLGRGYYLVATSTDDQAEKLDYIDKGLEACEKAVKLNANSADAHKWYAILVGSRGDFQPMKEKIKDGHIFKEHIDVAIKLNPNDSSLHHLLGRFAYEVASLKWYERKAAAALYTEPPNATYEDALLHFTNAEQLSKRSWKENKLLIAKCYIALGNYKNATHWLEKAKEVFDDVDEKIDQEINNLLDKYIGYR